MKAFIVGDQRVPGFVEERFEVGTELLAHVIEGGIARDQPGRLQHQHLRHQRAEPGRGQQRAVELPHPHLANHRHFISGHSAVVHLEIDLPLGTLFEFSAELLKRLAKPGLPGRQGCDSKLMRGRRIRFSTGFTGERIAAD